MVRILALSDIHAGAHSSIIPPWNQYSQHNMNTPLGNLQKELWKEVCSMPEEHRCPDVFFFLGDAIEGKATRKGGVELYTADRLEQVDLAEDALDRIRIPKEESYFVRGTPYHVGDDENFEDLFAAKYSGRIANDMFVKIEGVTFHLKHKASSSAYEHLRPSSIARERYYMMMKSQNNGDPNPEVILRGHIHYNIGAYGPGWEAASVPAFTATGFNDYGTRQCNGVVHFGYTIIDVDGENWNMSHYVTPLATTTPKVFKFNGGI